MEIGDGAAGGLPNWYIEFGGGFRHHAEPYHNGQPGLTYALVEKDADSDNTGGVKLEVVDINLLGRPEEDAEAYSHFTSSLMRVFMDLIAARLRG